MTIKVLITGLLLDQSLMPPGVQASELQAVMDKQQATLRSQGIYEIHDFCQLNPDLNDLAGTVTDKFVKVLKEVQPDIVMLGNGVRGQAKLAPVFEILVNTTREIVPKAKFAFNDGIGGTAAAVNRIAPP